MDPTRQPRIEIKLSLATNQTGGENRPERTERTERTDSAGLNYNPGRPRIIGSQIILTREEAESKLATVINPEEFYRDLLERVMSGRWKGNVSSKRV